MPTPRDVTHFASPAGLRAWFRANHSKAAELWVGYHKKATGRPSVTWAESVDQALCVGWIDGIRKRLGPDTYTIRFTPRRAKSIWSAINIARVKVLTEEKRMRPVGLQAFAARQENRSGIYAYEQRPLDLAEPYAGQLRRHKAASAFHEAQPPSYRKRIAWWIVSAKKDETRRLRMEKLIEACARGQRLS